MNKEYSIGIDERTTEEGADVMSAPVSAFKAKRKPFAYWNVGDTELKLKLTTAQITKLEEKYKKNLLFVITSDMPTVSVMLTVIQAAASPWNHGIDIGAIMDLYDQYVEEGHTQTDLLESVVLPTMGVSGFLSADQMEAVEKALKK